MTVVKTFVKSVLRVELMKKLCLSEVLNKEGIQ